jgi:mannosyltransferase OCH1-like enzyme
MSQSKHRRHGKTSPHPSLKTVRALLIDFEKDIQQPLWYTDDQLNNIILPVFVTALFSRLRQKHGGNQWSDWTDDQINSEAAQIIRELKLELALSTVSAA